MARYRLIKKLARGGMAEVFLADAIGPEGFRKRLVIKRILPALATNTEFVEMFLNEARLAAQLTHPNVGQIFELGHMGASPFLSMEYIDGPNLRSVSANGQRHGRKLDPDVAVKIAALACEGLAYAHELRGDSGPLNLIHRDVSPENIMVSSSGSVKVVDFGIAKASSSQSQTQVGTIKGKISYMAPEQVTAQKLDHRVDQYAMGIVLYELLSGGKKPFNAPGMHDLMREVAFGQAVPLADVAPEVPEALRKIVARAMAKEPEARYANCRELAGELERYLVMKGAWVSNSAIAAAIGVVMGTDTSILPALTPIPREGVELEVVIDSVEDGEGPSGVEPAKPSLEEELFGEIEAEGESTQAAVALGIASTAVIGKDGDDEPEPKTAIAANPTAAFEPEPEDETLTATDALKQKPKPSSRPPVAAIVAGAVLLLGGGAFLLRPKGAPSEPVAATTAPEKAIAPKSEPAPEPGPAPAAESAPAPTAAAPAAATVLTLLRVESTPSVEAFIDGKSYGPTPADVKGLSPGSHTLRLEDSKQGLSRELSVEVKANDITVSNTVFAQGRLTVRAKPFARVAVDGRDYGVTPIPAIALFEGPHKVELTYDGGGAKQKRTKSVTIKHGQEARVLEVFER